MAGGAHLGVFPLETIAVESRPVGIEPATAPRRVAGEAIALGVAADAGLQALPRCLSMPDQEELLRVMKTGAQRPLGHQARLLVTGRAEPGRAMTVRARALSRIGCRRMTGEETGRMIATHRRGGWSMAIEAFGPGVT